MRTSPIAAVTGRTRSRTRRCGQSSATSHDASSPTTQCRRVEDIVGSIDTLAEPARDLGAALQMRPLTGGKMTQDTFRIARRIRLRADQTTPFRSRFDPPPLWHIVDSIGVSIAGASPGEESGAAFAELRKAMGTGAAAQRLLGLNASASAETAALVNGSLAQALEMDDKHGYSLAPPGLDHRAGRCSRCLPKRAICRSKRRSSQPCAGHEVMIRLGLVAERAVPRTRLPHELAAWRVRRHRGHRPTAQMPGGRDRRRDGHCRHICFGHPGIDAHRVDVENPPRRMGAPTRASSPCRSRRRYYRSIDRV